MVFVQLVLLAVALRCGEEPNEGAAPQALKFVGKLSALSIPAEKLFGDWSGPTGLVVDDLNDLSDVPAEQRSLVESTKADFGKIGVVGIADFTYRSKKDAMHQITLRVFVFDSEQSCHAWWKSKYEYDGWEKHYVKVPSVPYKAVDSSQVTKRMVAMGNLWITSGALRKTDDHIKMLDVYIAAIKKSGA